MPVTLEQSEALRVIRLEGPIDIGCAAELKQILLQALESKDEVSVSMESATDLDVTAMQLLWAAAREANVSGVELTLTGPVPEGISISIANAGIESLSIPVCNQ
jgi:anti-anti-sigma factor